MLVNFLARSNPEINIRKWTIYKSWQKEKGLLVCFGVDSVSYRYLTTHDMRLFFELSTIQFRLPHSNKDKPQAGPATDTRASDTGHTNATRTHASGPATETDSHHRNTQIPSPPSHHTHHPDRTAAQADTAGAPLAHPTSRTATQADTVPPSLMSLNLGGATGFTDTKDGTVTFTDTNFGTGNPDGTAKPTQNSALGPLGTIPRDGATGSSGT